MGRSHIKIGFESFWKIIISEPGIPVVAVVTWAEALASSLYGQMISSYSFLSSLPSFLPSVSPLRSFSTAIIECHSLGNLWRKIYSSQFWSLGRPRVKDWIMVDHIPLYGYIICCLFIHQLIRLLGFYFCSYCCIEY